MSDGKATSDNKAACEGVKKSFHAWEKKNPKKKLENGTSQR